MKGFVPASQESIVSHPPRKSVTWNTSTSRWPAGFKHGLSFCPQRCLARHNLFFFSFARSLTGSCPPVPRHPYTYGRFLFDGFFGGREETARLRRKLERQDTYLIEGERRRGWQIKFAILQPAPSFFPIMDT